MGQWLEEDSGKDYGLTIVSHTEPFDIEFMLGLNTTSNMIVKSFKCY